MTPSGWSPFFKEQYRWDTRFQNLGLIIAGGYELCKGQIDNLVSVYTEYGRIPNALASDFLSHAQPPLETTCVFDLLNAGLERGVWSDECIESASREIFTEWIDLWEDKQHSRMNVDLVERYGFLTRHANVHFHALLVGNL